MTFFWNDFSCRSIKFFGLKVSEYVDVPKVSSKLIYSSFSQINLTTFNESLIIFFHGSLSLPVSIERNNDIIFQYSNEDFEREDDVIMNGIKFLKHSKNIEAMQCFAQVDN
jgi:hypothetical protein